MKIVSTFRTPLLFILSFFFTSLIQTNLNGQCANICAGDDFICNGESFNLDTDILFNLDIDDNTNDSDGANNFANASVNTINASVDPLVTGTLTIYSDAGLTAAISGVQSPTTTTTYFYDYDDGTCNVSGSFSVLVHGITDAGSVSLSRMTLCCDNISNINSSGVVLPSSFPTGITPTYDVYYGVVSGAGSTLDNNLGNATLIYSDDAVTTLDNACTAGVPNADGGTDGIGDLATGPYTLTPFVALEDYVETVNPVECIELYAAGVPPGGANPANRFPEAYTYHYSGSDIFTTSIGASITGQYTIDLANIEVNCGPNLWCTIHSNFIKNGALESIKLHYNTAAGIAGSCEPNYNVAPRIPMPATGIIAFDETDFNGVNSGDEIIVQIHIRAPGSNISAAWNFDCGVAVGGPGDSDLVPGNQISSGTYIIPISGFEIVADYDVESEPNGITTQHNLCGDMGSAVEFVIDNCATSVPTLGEWGLIILALALLNISLLFLMRRRRILHTEMVN